jgi:ornithine cyclodeaminase/alanine dehydrogenase-like protein (mu-crystallin family)
MIVLDENDVRASLRMDELIPAMARALADLSAGKAVQPVRAVVPVADHRGFFGSMPAYNGALGAKLVTFYPYNEGVHTHHGVIVLFRPETGEPLAMMDGRLITEMRTAAVSAVATDLLARRDARTLALIGSGVQAKSHLQALRIVRHFDEVRVWSPRNAAKFAMAHSITAAETAKSAVRNADVVVVATNAQSPCLFGEWVSPGTHVNAVGANRPTWRELDDEILRKSRVFVESRESAVVESGDLISGGEIAAEIGQLVSGQAVGRRSDVEITLFKSLGTAVEDIASADLVYRNFTRSGRRAPIIPD